MANAGKRTPWQILLPFFTFQPLRVLKTACEALFFHQHILLFVCPKWIEVNWFPPNSKNACCKNLNNEVQRGKWKLSDIWCPLLIFGNWPCRQSSRCKSFSALCLFSPYSDVMYGQLCTSLHSCSSSLLNVLINFHLGLGTPILLSETLQI